MKNGVVSQVERPQETALEGVLGGQDLGERSIMLGSLRSIARLEFCSHTKGEIPDSQQQLADYNQVCPQPPGTLNPVQLLKRVYSLRKSSQEQACNVPLAVLDLRHIFVCSKVVTK